MKLYPVIIVGGGPAGMITAVQLKRYGIEAVLFERKRLGGLLWNANLVENYPGFPGGIPGPELAERIIEQYQSHGLEPIAESVSQVDFDGERFLVATDDEVSSAELVVIATGTNAKQFPPTFANPKVSGHFYYEVADLADLHQSKIAIIGHPNTAVKAVQVQPDGLLIETVDGEEQKAYKVDVLLGAIGRCATRPDFTTRLKARETNLINERRLHLIGDVQNGIYRQTAIAVGDGLRKAMEIYQYLMETNQ
jgi:thioredoxin reductase (NADPH)